MLWQFLHEPKGIVVSLPLRFMNKITLESPKNIYKVVKSGKKYQVCKVVSEYDTEKEALEAMLIVMRKEK